MDFEGLFKDSSDWKGFLGFFRGFSKDFQRILEGSVDKVRTNLLNANNGWPIPPLRWTQRLHLDAASSSGATPTPPILSRASRAASTTSTSRAATPWLRDPSIPASSAISLRRWSTSSFQFRSSLRSSGRIQADLCRLPNQFSILLLIIFLFVLFGSVWFGFDVALVDVDVDVDVPPPRDAGLNHQHFC